MNLLGDEEITIKAGVMSPDQRYRLLSNGVYVMLKNDGTFDPKVRVFDTLERKNLYVNFSIPKAIIENLNDLAQSEGNSPYDYSLMGVVAVYDPQRRKYVITDKGSFVTTPALAFVNRSNQFTVNTGNRVLVSSTPSLAIYHDGNPRWEVGVDDVRNVKKFKREEIEGGFREWIDKVVDDAYIMRAARNMNPETINYRTKMIADALEKAAKIAQCEFNREEITRAIMFRYKT